MIFGIKEQQKQNSENKSAIVMELYFNSLVEAVKTVRSLNKGDKNFHYGIYKVSKAKACNISEYDIVLSKEEFFTKQNQRKMFLLKQLESKQKNEIIEK